MSPLSGTTPQVVGLVRVDNKDFDLVLPTHYLRMPALLYSEYTKGSEIFRSLA